MAPKFTEDEIDDLLYFARTGEKEEFDTLREQLCKREGCSIVELLETAKDTESRNAVLHMCAANGHSELLKHILQLLSNPSPQTPPVLAILNTQNGAGNTPLHWAALNGHLECVKALLEQGADPTLQNNRGHDAVFEAELNDRTEVVEWVLREGGEGLESGLGGEGGGEGSAGDEEMDEGEEVNGEGEKEAEVAGKGKGKETDLEKGVEGLEINGDGKQQ
ncbi:ankyrin repeat-containing protein [Clarireedia jacksonii]